MARYYLDKKLTVTGLVPGSNVGVWKSEDVPVRPEQRQFQPSEEVFLQQCQRDSVTFRVPEGQLVIRVRNYRYHPIEQRFHTTEVIDGTMHFTQVRG